MKHSAFWWTLTCTTGLWTVLLAALLVVGALYVLGHILRWARAGE